MRYSIEPIDQIPKLSFAKNIGKKLGGKYCQTLLARAKNLQQMHFKKNFKKQQKQPVI